MKTHIILTLCLAFGFLACQNTDNSSKTTIASIEQKAKAIISKATPNHKKFIDPDGKTVATRIQTPEGFERLAVKANSLGEYLRNLPVKSDDSPVLHYDGSQKMREAHVAVLDIDVGKRDLQQCADAVMRMRAEYLFKEQRYEDIHFNFTNGFRVDYSKWREGNRIMVKGNKSWWEKKAQPDSSYESFRKYLNEIFMYAGSLSLSKEMKSISTEQIKAGDVFILGGSPGHAATVMDVAKNSKTGKTLFLLSQSYMPAQDIHILKNEEDSELSPWFPLDFGERLLTPEFVFNKDQLMRFSD